MYPDWDFEKSSLQRQVNKTVIWRNQHWDLRSVTRGKEKKPQNGTCATPRERWAAIPIRSPVWKGSLFTTGQPWWFPTPFLSHHSPELIAGRWVPHKLRGKIKLGVGLGAQIAPPQAKGLCPEHGSEPLRSETWALPLLSEQQLQWATKRSLGLLKLESWRQAQTHRSAISQGKAPLPISVSLKSAQENSQTFVPPLHSLQTKSYQLLLPKSEVTYTKPHSTLLPVVFLSVLFKPWWVGAHKNYNDFL